ncbi:MAG: hypothetical protein AAFO86_08975 [Pseudomonadota bacterium]
MPKTLVQSGDQVSFAIGFNPRSIVVTNTSEQGNTAYRFAWIYNDDALIGQPAVSEGEPKTLGPVDADTLNPEQKSGSNGPVQPSTIVIYNLGPFAMELSKLGE